MEVIEGNALIKTKMFSSVADEWEITENGAFVSPSNNIEKEQILLFADSLNNGHISASIEFLQSASGKKDSNNEASLVFRYGSQSKYYYVGLGLFAAKFGVAKTIPHSPRYMEMATAGDRASLVNSRKCYNLKVAFQGSQIHLYENGVRQIAALDEDYRVGQWGLKTWNCQAKFSSISLARSEPVAFIVMPFKSELDYVHQTISDCLRNYGVKSVRGDQMFSTRPIVDDLKEQIANADLVLVDFTGRNPNVYYEAGLADAWKKDWIILVQSADDLAFDVRHIRTIQYSNAMGADMRLESDLSKAMEALGYRQRKT